MSHLVVFDYHCVACDKIEEMIVSYSDRLLQKCQRCGADMVRLFTASGFDGSYERKRFPYYDEQLDRNIESKQHKREVLKEMGLVQHDGHWAKGNGNSRTKRGVIYSIPKG